MKEGKVEVIVPLLLAAKIAAMAAGLTACYVPASKLINSLNRLPPSIIDVQVALYLYAINFNITFLTNYRKAGN